MKLNYWREHISVIGYHFFFLIDHEIEAPKEGWNQEKNTEISFLCTSKCNVSHFFFYLTKIVCKCAPQNTYVPQCQ